MVSWTADGGLAGYDPITKAAKAGLYHFATSGPAAVDLNAATRFGYVVAGAGKINGPDTTAPITFTSGDITSNNIPGTPVSPYSARSLVVRMQIAPASAFAAGVTPTIQQIKDAATFGARSNESYTTAGAKTFTIPGPTNLSPNTKYWIAIFPQVYYTYRGFATYEDMAGTTKNSIGRGLSFWTNRSPGAPVITSPTPNSSFDPGDVFTLTYDTNDDDELSPDDSERLNRDLGGVEIQYAAQPTADNPNPEWQQLMVTDTFGGTSSAVNWYLRGTNSDHHKLADDLGCSVQAGADLSDVAGDSNRAALPAGNWQIRLRTFDFGHAYPSTVGPGNALNTPETMPALNTSPWSAAVKVTVVAQVPPPVPLSPKDNIAVAFGSTVRLTWQYRNTFHPPFAQATRTVQLRKVLGGDDWTTVATGAGAAAYFDVSGLDISTWYEWRVKVTDTDGKESNYSEVARFWVVPVPDSGDGRPTPAVLIDGATLGCGTHTVEIYRRGGLERVGVIKGITYLDWERKRDDVSTSKVVVKDWDIDCGNLLASLQTWAYEVVIWRDNGYSRDRVWEGPITLLTYEDDAVTIEAKDVMGYAYRRIIKQQMTDTNSPTSVVDRARRVIQNAFAPDDPNVLVYLTILARDDDAMQYRSTPAYSRTAFEEVDDMAANAGLDYTTVGRAIVVWGTKHRIGTLPEFRDSDLGASPIVSEYGMSFADRYVVSDGNGVWGEATRGLDPVSGNNETYGLVEMLSSTWASDSTSDSGTYTQAGLQTMIQSFEEFAERSIADRFPPPVVVRVPDNTSLNPDTVISIQDLVPGVVIPLRSTRTLRTVVGSQKLDSVKVVEESSKETITITMSAFNRDDATGGEVVEG